MVSVRLRWQTNLFRAKNRRAQRVVREFDCGQLGTHVKTAPGIGGTVQLCCVSGKQSLQEDRVHTSVMRVCTRCNRFRRSATIDSTREKRAFLFEILCGCSSRMKIAWTGTKSR